MSKGSGLAPTGQAGAFFALRRKETPGTLRKVPGVLQYGGGRGHAELRLWGWLVFHQFAVVCLHQQQGGLFGPTVGEVEHLAAAALCQQVVDGKAAGLAIGDELDGLCAVVLQVTQGVQVAGKGGRVVGTGVGAQGAVLAHGKGLVHALSVHHPQLKGAVGVERLALGGTAVGAGVGAVSFVHPVVCCFWPAAVQVASLTVVHSP